MFYWIWQLIYLVTFVASLYALIEALRTPAQAFEIMDKQTKKLWVILTGVASGLSLLAVLSGTGMFVILGLVADPTRCAELSRAGRAYVRRWHDGHHAAEVLSDFMGLARR